MIFSPIQRFAKSIWDDDSNRGQRIQRLTRAGAWQFWKRLIGRPVVANLFNGMGFRVYPDCQTSSAVIYFVIPYSSHVNFFRSQIRGGTLVDVGANVGLHTLLLADRLDGAWLFEPNPAAASRASENLRLNKLDFEVHQLALSDRVGSIQFEDRGGVNSTNRTVVGFQSDFPVVAVRATTFDEFMRTRTQIPGPFFVKIDVEGHENAVLRGMRQFLLNQRPRLVMFEYLQRTNLKETFQIFDETGYRVIVLGKDRIPRWADVSVAPLQDLFACPEEIGYEVVGTTPTSYPLSD